jgi:paraquat-inducible protein B
VTETDPLPSAKSKRAAWPGVVWAIPIAALLIVAYLGLRAIADHGVDVVVTFESAAGAKASDTKVNYKGVEVGHVTKVAIAKDARHVDLYLRLDGNLKPVLRTGTRFWLVGANPSLTDLNSLKAAVSGLTIGMAPGPGEPTRQFAGLEQEPVITPGTPGRSFWLEVETLSAVRRGSTVIYHGDEVGKVTDVEPAGSDAFRAKIFVDAPFDQFVRPSSLFWNASSVQISLNGQGLSGEIASPETALSGGVAFETPRLALSDPPSPTGSRFLLYPDEQRAREGPDGVPIPYATIFKGAAGQVEPGASVTLKGTRIGVVRSVGLNFDAGTGVLSNPVSFDLFPERLHVRGVDPNAPQDWRAVSDRAVTKLIQLGYRLNVEQTPPIVGAQTLAFEKANKVSRQGTLDHSSNPPLVPTTESQAGSITDKLDEILTKVNAVPIAAIGADVRQITGRLRTLLGSPKVDDSLDHLDGTLKSVDQIAREVKPKIGPLIDKLNQTADQLQQTVAAANDVLSGSGGGQDANLPGAIRELTDAARSIRALADYLGRHPEAIIQGKVKD